MNYKDILIVALVIALILLVSNNKGESETIELAKAEIKIHKDSIKSVKKELEISKKYMVKSLDSLEKLSRRDGTKLSKKIEMIPKLKANEVKSELLKDTEVKVDSSDLMQITVNESKGILAKYLESRKELLISSFNYNKLKVINRNLNKTIAFKDSHISNLNGIIDNHDVIFTAYKVKARKRIIKITVISFIAGGITAVILK